MYIYSGHDFLLVVCSIDTKCINGLIVIVLSLDQKNQTSLQLVITWPNEILLGVIIIKTTIEYKRERILLVVAK